MSRELAIVTVSGGLDSCVTAAVASQTYELAFVHFNYGQRTEKRELQAFHDLADYYDVSKRLIIDFYHLAKIGGSSLTDLSLEITDANLDCKEIPTSYVPFRNANIISAAVSWAEVIGAKKVFIGAVDEDSSGYPDCSSDFFLAFNKVIETGTKPGTVISVETPVISFKKAEIIQKGIDINAPLHLTWSCYRNDEEACGECDSCALRLRGFQTVGIEDPIQYKQRPIYT